VDIQPGEEITVLYTDDGSHNSSQLCPCSVCQPGNPPAPASSGRRPQPMDIPAPKPGRKTRQGGRRWAKRLKNWKDQKDWMDWMDDWMDWMDKQGSSGSIEDIMMSADNEL